MQYSSRAQTASIPSLESDVLSKCIPPVDLCSGIWRRPSGRRAASLVFDQARMTSCAKSPAQAHWSTSGFDFNERLRLNKVHVDYFYYSDSYRD